MTDLLTRIAGAGDLEVRGDGRTVVGLAVPFDTPAEIRDASGAYTETFRRGAFARTLAERGPERIKLLAQHNLQSLPLGRLTSAVEDTAGLRIEARVSATTAGDEVLELVRDGAIDALSIGFRPVPAGDRWTTDRRAVERREVRLHEVSLVAFPAYTGALIAAVRSDLHERCITDSLERLAALTTPRGPRGPIIPAGDLARRYALLTGK